MPRSLLLSQKDAGSFCMGILGWTRFGRWSADGDFFGRFRFCGSVFGIFPLPSICMWGAKWRPIFAHGFLRIKTRGGLLSKWWSFLFLNKGVRQSRTREGLHERDYNLAILWPLGMSGDGGETFCPRLQLGREEVTDFRRELGIPQFVGGLIVLHPGMRGHTVNWPSLNYAKLAVLLERRNPGRYVYVFGHTPSDEVYIAPIREYFRECQGEGPRCFFFDGSLKGLRHYMGLLSQASCVVAPSTGITHLANALGVGQVGLYGPVEVQSPRRWGPCRRGSQVKVLVPEVSCPEYSSCRGTRVR